MKLATHAVVIPFAGTIDWTVLAGPDQLRLSLLCPSAGNGYSLAFGESTAALGTGFALAAGANPFVLRREDIGDLLASTIWCKCVAAQNLSFLAGRL